MAGENRIGSDVELLDDEELATLVREVLESDPTVEEEWIDVEVADGRVTLEGRVGSEAEREAAEWVVRETIGVDDLENELVVDELHRGETPEDPIEAQVEADAADPLVGEPDPNQTSSSEHLGFETDEGGTRDTGKAVESGVPYTPPDRPAPRRPSERIGEERGGEEA